MITVLIDELDKRVVADAEGGDAQRRTTNGFGRRMPNIKRWIRHYVSAKPQSVARRTGAVLLAAATALVGAVVAPAQAYDQPVTTLVQNTGQSSGRTVSLCKYQDGLYQGFTTGPYHIGYELNSISLYVQATRDSRDMTIEAGLYRGDNRGPSTKVADLTRGHLDNHAHNEWQAPADTFLEPNTEYYIVLDCVAGCGGDNVAEFGTTDSYEEDSGAEAGWTVLDNLGFRSVGSITWKRYAKEVLKIRVKGRLTPHRVSRTEIISTPVNGHTYLYGENIDIALTFNSEVYVPEDGAVIAIRVGDATDGSNYRAAEYLSGSFTTQLIYRYEVQVDDADANGISVDEGGPDSGFGELVPTSVASLGLWPVDRYYPGLAADSNHKVDGSFHVTDVEITSRPAHGDGYRLGENIDITLTFSTKVHILSDGAVIAIRVGDATDGSNYRAAEYLSGSGTHQLVYRYRVQASDFDATGVSVDTGGPNSGFGGPLPVVSSSRGPFEASRRYAGLAADSNHKVDGSLHTSTDNEGAAKVLPPATDPSTLEDLVVVDLSTLVVSDARVMEEAEATLDFVVTRIPGIDGTVTVDYATADGTAQAGQDYTAAEGTLTFTPEETQKTVSIAVLDDAHDEGEETLTLILSNALGADIADDTATGTIENDDPLQQAWLARFGRTAAQRVLDGVQARLRAPHQAGMQATVAGRDLSGAGEVVAQDRFKTQSEWVRDEATEVQFRPQSLTMRDLMTGSGFTLGSETVGGLGTLWGRGTYSGFDGSVNGLALDGGVTTGMLGADYAVGRWVLGLPLSHSRGNGSWHSTNLGEGRMSSSLTGLYPYAGYELTERLSLWGTAGYGQGDLALMMQEGESYHTAMGLTMAAVGVRGDLVSARQAGGLSLAVESDALLVRTTSAAAADPSGLLAAAVGDVSRLRLGLEGSLDLALTGGRSLTPTVELGLRHDGGDAETGFGMEVGGGTVFADAARGLMAQVMMRGLVAHEAADFRDWRISGSLRFDPTPSSALGPAVALTPSWGAPSSGGVAALLGRETLVGLAANDAAASGRLDAEAAYGLAVFGGRATGTPYLRVGQSEAFREVRMGYRLELLRWEGLEMGIEGTQRESTVANMAPDREVMLHLALSAP